MQWPLTAQDQLEIYRNLYVYTMEYCMYPEVVEVDPQEKDGPPKQERGDDMMMTNDDDAWTSDRSERTPWRTVFPVIKNLARTVYRAEYVLPS